MSSIFVTALWIRWRGEANVDAPGAVLVTYRNIRVCSTSFGLYGVLNHFFEPTDNHISIFATAWSNISQHALNTVFALFEVVLTHAGPSPWSHLIFLVVILGGYLGIAYITHATEGFYSTFLCRSILFLPWLHLLKAYAFLNPQKEHGLLAGYIVGIAVAECIIFAVVRVICYLRKRITRTHSSRFLLDAHDPEEIEDWQDVERPDTPNVV